jgi:hypothetical protein
MKLPDIIGILRLSIAYAVIMLLQPCVASEPLYRFMTPSPDGFDSSRIPLKFDHGYPYLTLFTRDDSFDVFLDTGAAQSALILLPETVQTMRLAAKGEVRGILTNYGEYRYRRSILSEVRLGDVVFWNVACDQDSLSIPGMTRRRGRMGLALLRPFCVLIDYGASGLVLFNPDRSADSLLTGGGNRFPFQDSEDGILISGSVDGQDDERTWLLDTGVTASDGSGYFNLLKPKRFREIKDVQERDGRCFVKNRSLRIGSTVIDSLNLVSHDFRQPKGVDGFLGADFFMKHRVLVDFKKSMIYTQPISRCEALSN